MLRLRTLGESAIEIGSARIGPESVVLFGLLLFLAMHRGRPVARRRIRDLFWPDVTERKAGHSLRQLIYRARRLGVVVETTTSHVTLDAAQVDADFLSLDAEPRAISEDPRSHREVGQFLHDYCPRFSLPFETWVDEQRSIVHARLRNALLAAISSNRARGNWIVVEQLARNVLAVDPLNEEATLSLAEATALAGSKIEAVALLDRYVAALGVAPNRQLELPPTLLRRRIAERLPEAPVLRPPESAFVGRGDSMVFLHRALQRAKRGASESCYFWGSAGIGKTRLLDEFRAAAVLDGTRVERLACQACDIDRPMSVFAGLVPRLLSLPGALGCAPESFEFLQRLVAHDTNAVSLSPETSEAAFLAANIRHAIYDLVDAVAAEGPLLIIVEDIHWADLQSRRLVRELVRWVGSRSVAVVCSSREPPKAEHSEFAVRHLKPLTPADTRALIRSLVAPGTAFDATTSDRCVRIAEGNPLYAKTLVDLWQLTGDTSAVPPSMAALLADRLGGLNEECLLALQATAILGRNATAKRVTEILQFRSYQLVQALNTLAVGGLITDEAHHIACAHELIACAALDRLTGIARRSLHRLTAEQLENDKLDSTDAGLLWDCASHWKQAGEPERAIRFALDCSKHLLELGLPHEASELLLSARRNCDDAGTTNELLGVLAVAFQQCARWTDLVEVLADKFRRSKLGEPVASVHGEEELMFLEGSLRAELGELGELARRAAICAESTASANHRLRAAAICLIIHSECCDEPPATATYRRIYDARKDPSADPILTCDVDLLYHTSFGDVLRGAEAADNLIELARKHASPQALARALRFANVSLRMAGRLQDAEEVLLEALEVARHYKLATAVAQATSKMAVLKIVANEFEVALDWSRRAIALVPGNVPRIHGLERTVTHIQAHLGLGDIQSAVRAYDSQGDYSIPEELLRGVTEFAALKMRISIERNPWIVAQLEVESLYALYLRMRDKGVQDFTVASLIRGLESRGDRTRAEAVYVEYVGCHRRERTPLSQDLQLIGTRLNTAESTHVPYGTTARTTAN